MRLPAAAVVLLASGCLCRTPTIYQIDAGENVHPEIVDVELASWPPLGPDDVVTVEVADVDENLDEVVFHFARRIWRRVSGSSARVTVSGTDLGEGLGTLAISVTDRRGLWGGRRVERLLVDLTPPRAAVGPTVLRADGQGENGALRVWIGDAWIVGRAELHFADVVLTHEIAEGWPSTLGVAWDWSLVTFEADALPTGAGPAELVVFDAAGNVTVEELELVVDGIAPTVSILSPEPGALLSGNFLVQLEASDEGDGPVWIELSGGGALLATAAGPRADITLDTADLPAGPVDLVAVAFDLAGYESAPAQITVYVVE